MTLEEWSFLTSVVVDLTVLTAAIIAVFKFQIFKLLSPRFKSELSCKHYELKKGDVLFTADFIFTNTGERPIKIRNVSLKLMKGMTDKGGLLIPVEDDVVMERNIQGTDPDKKGIFQIQSGERSIFTLRCRLPRLNDISFVKCTYDWGYSRKPAMYLGLYVKEKLTSKRDAALPKN